MIKVRQLWFTAPYTLEQREYDLGEPGPEEIRVRTLYSGISAGTEMLAYRNELPKNQPLDVNVESLANCSTTYPFQYGYANVGRVEAVGSNVDKRMLGDNVFALQPHVTHYIARADSVIKLPAEMEPQAGIFLANMETALNLILDARPLLGEKIVVLGQGVVGLLVSAILARFFFAEVYALDPIPGRRDSARELGVANTVDSNRDEDIQTLKAGLRSTYAKGADLILELTGSPAALNLGLDLCAYSGRIVVGSWYGSKPVTLELGGRFHRERIKIVSSQVSSINPELSGRWDHSRRFDTALDLITRISPEKLITHTFGFDRAHSAYQLLDTAPETAVQVVLSYVD